MATISNIIQTVFQSSGANNTNRDIDRINRNMTRLGQSSASAGRSFAAQSQGLGGLVAAYAGAAATTFALQQAFDKLAQSARQTQTLEGLNTLAARSGESSSILLENVRELTKNQITLAEAASQINLSLSAGFDSSQIEGLSEVALKASRALGRDLNDAYTRVVRGSAKMETELLDELGIYTKIDPATRSYAAAIDKTVGQLTEFERRQAFVNAVIEEGNRKYSSINTTIPTTAEKIEAFGTRILDIAGIFGRFLAEQAAPLAEFLTNNLTASFAAFGAIASLIAGKGIAVLRDSLGSLTSNIVASGAAAEQNARKFLGIERSAIQASQGIANYERGLVNVTRAEKEAFLALQETARQRTLSTRELKIANAIIEKNRTEINRIGTALADERRQLQQNIAVQRQRQSQAEQAVISARQQVQSLIAQGAATQQVANATNALRTAQASLGGVTASTNRQLAALTSQYNANQEAIRGNLASLRALQAAQVGAIGALGTRGSLAGALSAVYSGLATAVGAAGNAITGLVGKALGIFSVVSLFTLLGSSIANALGKAEEFDAFMRGFSARIQGIFTDENAKRISNVLQGVTVGALEELERTDKELRDINEFTFDTKFLGFDIELTKTKEDLVREVNSELQTALDGGNTKATLTSFGSIAGGAIGGAIGIALGSILPFLGQSIGLAIGTSAGSTIGRLIQDEITGTELSIDNISGGQEALDSLKLEYSEAFAAVGEDLELALAKAFQNLEDTYGTAAIFDPIARQALELQKQLLADSAKYINNVESISRLTKATGVSANQITETFTFEKAENSAKEVASTILSLEGRDINLSFSFIDTLNEDLINLLQSAEYEVTLLPNIPQLKNSFLRGISTISSELSEALLSSTTFGDFTSSFAAQTEQFGDKYIDFADFLQQEFKLTEQQAEETIDSIRTAFKSGEGTFESLITKVEKITPVFNAANSAVNELSTVLARGAFNAKDLQDQINSGNIDLERFDQRFKAISSSANQAPAAFARATAALDIFREKASAIVDPQQREIALGLVSDLEEAINKAGLNAIANEEILQIFKAQREELEQQSKVREFLNSITKESKGLDVFSSQMSLMSVGLPEEGRLSAQVSYLNQFITATENQIESLDRLQNSLKAANISEQARAAIIGASAGETEKLVQALNNQENTEARIVSDGAQKYIEVIQGKIEKTDEFTAALSDNANRALVSVEDLGNEAALVSREVVDAIKVLIEDAIAELPKLIDTAIKDFRKLSRELIAETENIRNIEIPKLIFEAEIDRRQFDFDLAKLRTQSAITNLEFDLDITSLKRELGDITPETAIAEEGRIQNEILNRREELINLEAQNSANRYVEDLNLLSIETEQNKNAIESRAAQLTTEVNARVAYINSLISAYDSILSSQESVNNTNLQNTVSTYNAIAKGLYENIARGGQAVSAAISQALGNGGGAAPGSISISAPQLQTAEIDFVEAYDSLQLAQTEVLASIEANTQAQIEAENLRYSNAVSNRTDEYNLEQQGYNEALGNISRERELEGLRHRERVKNLADERAKGGKAAADRAAKEREKAQKELEKFYDEVEKGLKELKKLAADFVSLIFDGLISSKQLEVDAAKIGEGLANAALANTTERLNSVQNDLNESLNQETSIKDELVSLTERLNESQLNYLNAIKDGDLAKASEDYVDTILEQSRKTVELSDAIRTRTLLESAAQTLEQRKMSAEELAEQATRARIESEEELARVQEISAGVNSVLTSEIKGFTSALESLGPVIAKLTGQVSGGVTQVNNPIDALADSFNKTLKSVFDAQKLIGSGAPVQDSAGKVAKGIESATAKAGEAAANAGVTMANSFAAKAISGISSALQGAGVGSAIGQILGDDTYASTIGGAVGAGLATVFSGSAFMTSLTAGISSLSGGLIAGAAAASVATLGLSLVGGLIFGSLFGGPKKPTAKVEGRATETGFEVVDVSREDGLSKSAANSVGNFVEQVYDSIFTTLDKVGADFKDQVDVFVRNTEGEFGRVRTTFASGAVLTAADLGDDPQVAAEELINEFYQGLTIKRDDAGIVTFRSLVVDALTPNAAELQQAIDTFSAIEDINQKGQEQFVEFLEFANQFNDQITKLSSSAPSLADSLDLIALAATSNASNILKEYETFREQTARVFGTDSSQLVRANEALKDNALAQIGLAEASDGTVVSTKSLSSELTASRLSIAKTVADIEAFEAVLVSLGFSAQEAASFTDQAIDLAITDQVSEFATNISDALLSLKEPALAATAGLSAIQSDSAALVNEAEGLLESLIIEQSRGLDVAADITMAEIALANARELANLQVTSFLKDLTSSQLKFVIASEERFDSETRLLAQQQLVVAQQLEASESISKVNKGLKDFNSRIGNITGLISSPALKTGFTSLNDVLSLLGEVEISSFALQLSSAVNSIDATKNLIPQFTSSFELLDSSLNDGTITTEQYIDSLFLLVDTTLTAAESQKELADTYNEAVNSLRQFFDDALSEVQSAITGLRDEFISLVSGIEEATASIFDIYDSTVGDISSSSNELFDLRDSAREAFEASSEAVKQFEKANSLSGKSAALLTAELESIQSSIDSILAGGDVSFEDFLDLSRLTAQQNRLSRELSAVTALEEDYNALLSDRTSAAEDLAFIEDTILELGDSLVDSRRTESELIQRTIDATNTLISAQKDLEEITELLTENNFNLNQVRQDETDRVYQVTRALEDLEKNMAGLETLVSDLLNSSEVREEIDRAAEDLASIISGNLGDAASTFDSSILPIVEKVQAALGSGNLDLGGIDEIETAFDSLLATFTLESINPVDILNESFKTLNSTLEGIAATGIDPIVSTKESIDTLVSGILELESAINNITGGGGVDDLTQLFSNLIDTIAEKLSGIDVSTGVPIVSDIEREIQQAYQSVLGRNVDPEGLDFYRGVMQQYDDFDIIRELENSVEKQFLQPAFQSLLGRMPTVSEIFDYKDRITSQSQIENELRQTQEYRNLQTITPTTPTTPTIPTTPTTPTTPTIPTEPPSTGPSDADIRSAVGRGYIEILERIADIAGSNFYFDTIKADNGFGISDFRSDLRNSTEYQVLQAYKRITGKPGSSFSLSQRLPIIQSVERIPSFNYESYIQRNFATGGYVSGPGTSTSDSIPAMLSNGEFVMSAASVNSIGLGVLNMLNSGGNSSNLFTPDISLNTLNTDLLDRIGTTVVQNNNSDTNIEVNVVNNGTAQQPVSEPTVRRENGKIIVDVILEDIRNNGPIKRKIRSIR